MQIEKAKKVADKENGRRSRHANKTLVTTQYYPSNPTKRNVQTACTAAAAAAAAAAATTTTTTTTTTMCVVKFGFKKVNKEMALDVIKKSCKHTIHQKQTKTLTDSHTKSPSTLKVSALCYVFDDEKIFLNKNGRSRVYVNVGC